SADANNAGQLLELDAILAVALGGTALAGGRFSLAGSVVGALIIQALTTTIYAIGVPPQVNYVVKALLVVAVLLLQSPEFGGGVRGLARGPARGGAWGRCRCARGCGAAAWRACGASRAMRRWGSRCRCSSRCRWPAACCATVSCARRCSSTC